MLSIDQVKLLESKVAGAVKLIKNLSDENDSLKDLMEEKEARIIELEALILSFKEDQNQIEEKIISALNQLSDFENSVYEKKEITNVQVTNTVEKSKNTEVSQTSSSETEFIKKDLQKDIDDVLDSPQDASPKQEEIDTQLDIF